MHGTFPTGNFRKFIDLLMCGLPLRERKKLRYCTTLIRAGPAPKLLHKLA